MSSDRVTRPGVGFLRLHYHHLKERPMNVILRDSTRRMIDSSPAAGEAEGFIRWMRAG